MRFAEPDRISASDGTSLVVRRMIPEEPRSDVVLVHGWGEHGGRYEELATALAQRGHAVWTYDQRGHGESGGIKGHTPRFQNLIEDLTTVVSYARGRKGGERPLFIVGHSLGGLVTLRANQTGALSCRAWVYASPWLATTSAIPAWKLWLGEVLAQSLYAVPIPNSVKPEVLTRDEVKIQAHRQDALIHGYMTPRLFKEVEAAQSRALQSPYKVSGPALFLVPGADPLVDSSVTRSFTDRISGSETHVVEVPDARHELFNEIDRQRRYDDVAGFFDSVLKRGSVPVGGRHSNDAKGAKQDMDNGFREEGTVETNDGVDTGPELEEQVEDVRESSVDEDSEVVGDWDQPDESEADTGDAELQVELEATREKHLRLAAEFNNFRKRTDNDLRVRWDRAQAELVAKLLEPLDDLQRVAAWEPETTSVEAIVEGVDLVERKFLRVMDDLGMEILDPVGERFDPNTMEAMMRVPTDSDEEDEIVQQVFRKGYSLKGQLIRPAQVSVFKAD